MKLGRLLLIFIQLIIGFLVVGRVKVLASDGYEITNFSSHLVINQDTSITVTETIEVNFEVPKHGIFRVIPVIYSAK